MPKNEKWEISPKFEKSKTLAEIVSWDIVIDLVDKCFNRKARKSSEFADDNEAHKFGVWVPDPTLPEGWKTCLISKGEQRKGEASTPEKRMFYSPCGTLLSSRLSLDRFLEGQNVHGRTLSNLKSTKMKIESISPESEIIRPTDLCQPKIEAPDSDDASDAISLSDDDFEDDFYEKQPKRKFKDDSFTKCPKPKKRKLSYSQTEKYLNITKVQEAILEECYKEWPLPFPDLIEHLVKDTGLKGWVIDDWFVRKTDRCLRALFSQ